MILCMDNEIIEAFYENPFQSQEETEEGSCHDIQEEKEFAIAMISSKK